MYTTFSSTTKNVKTALGFAYSQEKKNYKNKFSGEIVLLKIYLNNDNQPPAHIDLSGGYAFSDYPVEEEILLLPHFNFMVVNVTEDRAPKLTEMHVGPKVVKKKARVTTITLKEIPF